jgi:zinc protease
VLDSTDDVQVPRVYVTWRAPAAFSAEEPALDMGAAILGDGKSSRLYKRLVFDEKIAQSVRADFGAEELAGSFEIVVTAKPGTDPKRLVTEINEEVAKLSATAPDAAEVERAVNSHESGFLDGLEATLQRAILLANYDVMAHDPEFFPKDIVRYRAVKPDQIKSVVAKYLKPNARVTLTIRPGKKPTQDQLQGKDHK